METKELYQQILNEHNINPLHKKEIKNADISLNGINPGCGDDITLNLKFDENGIITDGSFIGSGCAVSQASCDMMLDLIIGKSKNEAEQSAELFMKMIHGQITDEELEKLEDASSLQDIAHMPARVKCAVLGWRTMKEMLKGIKKN